MVFLQLVVSRLLFGNFARGGDISLLQMLQSHLGFDSESEEHALFGILQKTKEVNTIDSIHQEGKNFESNKNLYRMNRMFTKGIE